MLPLGDCDGSEAGIERQVDIARHLRGVVLARGMTPAEQVRCLMMAAASVIVGSTDEALRPGAMAQALVELTACVCGAADAGRVDLARMMPEGRA